MVAMVPTACWVSLYLLSTVQAYKFLVILNKHCFLTIYDVMSVIMYVFLYRLDSD